MRGRPHQLWALVLGWALLEALLEPARAQELAANSSQLGLSSTTGAPIITFNVAFSTPQEPPTTTSPPTSVFQPAASSFTPAPATPSSTASSSPAPAQQQVPTSTPTPTPIAPNVQILRPKSKLFKCHPVQQPCANGGLCFNGTCFCPQGYTGESCSVNIDECRLTIEPCLNGGECFDEVDSYRCACPSGFRGDRCQEAVDLCAPESPCLNGARCVNHRTDFTCLCQPGWEGRTCANNIDECSTLKACKNNSTCTDLINDYTCDCGSSGYTGKNCDQNIDDCAGRPCGPGAERCEDLVADFRCHCHDGWEGKRCDQDVPECLAGPCENNGVCRENSHLFNLTWPAMSGGATLADLNASPALNSSSQWAGFTCECGHEFYGDRCEERKKCFTEPAALLCNHKEAECQNVGASYECLINASFDGSGRSTAKYQLSSGISQAASFKLRDIYFKYRSLEGGLVARFEVSTGSHQLEQPQQQQPHWSPVELHLNKSGAYLSGPAIRRDEDSFFDQLSPDEFRLNLSGPLDVRSLTLAPAASVLASSPNADYPTPFHGCLMALRLNNQLVPFLKYGAATSSLQPFELVESRLELGAQCRTCFEKDCLNGGRCEFDRDTSYDHCVCPPGFQGTNCELDVNECLVERAACLNGAQCENTHGGFRCNCKDGYKGDKCQELADHCKALKPCGPGTCRLNGPQQQQQQSTPQAAAAAAAAAASQQPSSQVQAQTGGGGSPPVAAASFKNGSQQLYLCDCPSSHIGKRCERRRDCSNECSSQQAHCVANLTCACQPGSGAPSGLPGQMCEFVASCQQVQGELCKNGGVCRDLEPSGYECLCPEPFFGPICQHFVEKPQLDPILLIGVACVGFLMAACTVVSFVIFRSVRKARATRGTYSPSTQEKFGNAASDLLKPPQPERLI